MSCRSSVHRALARCSGGHGFDSCRDSHIFFVPCHARAMLISSLSSHLFASFLQSLLNLSVSSSQIWSISSFIQPCDDAVVRFVNGRCHFRDTYKFFNYQQIFLYLIKEKGRHASNHPVSNPKPLFPNIPLIPLHYQVDPPNFRKIQL